MQQKNVSKGFKESLRIKRYVKMTSIANEDQIPRSDENVCAINQQNIEKDFEIPNKCLNSFVFEAQTIDV